MKMKNIKIFLTLILAFAISFPIYSYGANDYSITSGISSIDEGKSYTVKINAKGLTGRFNISSSNASTSTETLWVTDGVPDSTVTVTPKGTGKVTVTYTPVSVANSSGDVLVDEDTHKLSSKTDTVTVKSKSSSNEKSSSKSSGTSNESSSSEKTTSTKKSATTAKKEETSAPSFTSTNEKVYSTGSVNVRESYSTSSKVIGSLKKGDSITRTGRSSSWSKVTYNGKTAYVSSSYLTTTKPEEEKEEEKEEENTVENEEADDNTTEEENTADEETAEDDNRAKLKELLIEGFTLKPEFQSDVYEYTLTVDKDDVTKLNITANPEDATSTVEITGNTELKKGENTVTITVTPEDEEEKEEATYKITVTIPEKKGLFGFLDGDSSLYAHMALGAGAAILVIILFVIIRKRRLNNYIDEFKLDDYKFDNSKEQETSVFENANNIFEDDSSYIGRGRGKHF